MTGDVQGHLKEALQECRTEAGLWINGGGMAASRGRGTK